MSEYPSKSIENITKGDENNNQRFGIIIQKAKYHRYSKNKINNKREHEIKITFGTMYKYWRNPF